MSGAAWASGPQLRDIDIEKRVNSPEAEAEAQARADADAKAAASNRNANVAISRNENAASNRNANSNRNTANAGNATASARAGDVRSANTLNARQRNSLTNDFAANLSNSVAGDVINDARNTLSNNSTSAANNSLSNFGNSTNSADNSLSNVGNASSSSNNSLSNTLSNDSMSNSNATSTVDAASTNTIDASSNDTTNATSTNTIDASSNDTINASSSNTNNNTANGGAGGAGGAGGNVTNAVEGGSSTVDASSANDVSNSANNAASNDNSTTFNGGDTNVEAIALDYDAIDLANLPVAVCQGSSTTASGSGNDGLFGVGLGFGRSNVDDQCTVRENIRTVATLAEYVPQLRKDLLQAVAHLDGFEHMWPQDQHPKCPKWIKKGSTKARKHNCELPNVQFDMTNMGQNPIANAVPPAPSTYTVYFEFDQSTLTPGAQEVVRRAAGQIVARDADTVLITAHTDRAGSEQYNQRLSERRAETVRQALVARGVDATIIQTEALGERRPVGDGRDGRRDVLNRRAEIIITVGDELLGS